MEFYAYHLNITTIVALLCNSKGEISFLYKTDTVK